MPRERAEAILVVEDNPVTLELLRRNLETEGRQVFTASTLTEAFECLHRRSFDLVVTDLKLADQDGLDLVRHVREHLTETEVMVVTGYATIEGAVEAVKGGAAEYLVKPFTDAELASAVQRSLEALRRRRTVHRAAPEATSPYPGLVGRSPAIQKVFSEIAKAAQTTATVLISGESGTGKELVARAIHYSGTRRSAPFVPVSCGAIPESLLESELFGHVKGAFTGASHSRTGFFQTADHGTIFLDEISETSPPIQAKLLRVLQEREIYLLGSSHPRRVDVRVIAATNKDLAQLVAQGAFREDLFYRIVVLTIELPPLRSRGDDILLLVNHFSEKYSRETGTSRLNFSDSALQALLRYHWPGNVRELQNLIQRLYVMSDQEVIEVSDLPELMRSAVPIPVPDASLAQVEASHIRNVLTAVGGNKSEAARRLGIDRKTLREKLRRYGLETSRRE